ncbi:MAG TPA: EcsC family protein [Solirubrobacter sp.]|nr:EcsC family protein [Solirubrobacter sp.]
MSGAEAEQEEPAAQPPAGLLARLRADPLRAPEHVALAASEQHAPAAARWAGRRRRVFGDDPRQLAEMARRRHAGLASVEGAATGVGGIVTVVPDLVGLAWIQSRLVFYVAAAYGFDPRDRMRPAELLVLMGIYDDVGAARAALDGVGASLAETWVGSKLARDEALVRKLALMVGKSAAMKVGRLIPGFAIFFNSVSNRRDTNRLARRAIRFYGG